MLRGVMVTEYPEVTDWGRIPPERRGRWGRWLYAQRWLHDRMTQDALRETLAKMGHPMSAPYYSDFEGGRAIPNDEWQAVFVRLWGTEPPPEQQEAATSTGDMAALVTELREQNAHLGRMVTLLTAFIAGDRPPTWFQVHGGGMTLALQERFDDLDSAVQRLLASSEADTRGRADMDEHEPEPARKRP